MRATILSKCGDFLPVFREEEVSLPGGETKKKVLKAPPVHKDGETPGQEWTRPEVAVIRALGNPATSSIRKASEISGVTVPTIRRWLRNPYFMNEIYRITNSHLQQARASVIAAVIRNARRGSASDRALFFKLTGDLKEEKRVELKQEVSFPDMSEKEMDDWIQDDIGRLNEGED